MKKPHPCAKRTDAGVATPSCQVESNSDDEEKCSESSGSASHPRPNV